MNQYSISLSCHIIYHHVNLNHVIIYHIILYHRGQGVSDPDPKFFFSDFLLVTLNISWVTNIYFCRHIGHTFYVKKMNFQCNQINCMQKFVCMCLCAFLWGGGP